MDSTTAPRFIVPADFKASEAARFRSKHPESQGVDALIPNLAGIRRGKRASPARPCPSSTPKTCGCPAASSHWRRPATCDYEHFFAAIEAGAARQGLPIEGMIKEAAPAQYEVNLHCCEDALRAADHGLMLKRLVKGVAERLGFAASFMAKPYPDHAGCSLHIHVSLLDREERNPFDDRGELGSPALRHA